MDATRAELAVEEAAVTGEAARCSVHGDREAVGTCVRCRRPACLDCAIPFRGELLCAEDAAEEIGAPTVAPSRDSRPVGRWAAAVLLLGVAATV
ncbi:MAG TPA: B-box zinc finger protein, partial [Actinomycetota bacterium]|nr:B-box zinc finger protein [Actinomycetota bacterium]